MAYPGTVTLRVETLLAVVRDILDCLAGHGFERIVIVNGHGGNNPVQAMAQDWMRERPEVRVKFHNWWMAPKTWAKVQEIDPVASHASWMENFPWTRLANIAPPEGSKEPIDLDYLRQLDPARVRDYLGDGNFAGVYQKEDETMLALWDVAVAETRELIEGPWG
jgi:creatinine amidohydrolase